MSHDEVKDMHSGEARSGRRLRLFHRSDGRRWTFVPKNRARRQDQAPTSDPVGSQPMNGSQSTLGDIPKPSQSQVDCNDESLTVEFPPLIDPSQLMLRVTILSGQCLAPKEQETNCNPYTVVMCGGNRERTHAVKKSVGPEWVTSFDLSLLDERRQRPEILWTEGLKMMVCSKGRLRSHFIGQIHLALQDLFCHNDTIAYDDPRNQPTWYALETTTHRRRFRLRRPRRRPQWQPSHQSQLSVTNDTDDAVSDTESDYPKIQIKMGLVLPGQEMSEELFTEIRQAWDMLVSIRPPSPGIDESDAVLSGGSDSEAVQSTPQSTPQLTPSEEVSLQDLSLENRKARGGRFRRRKMGRQPLQSQESMSSILSSSSVGETSASDHPKKSRVKRLRRRGFRGRKREHIAEFRSDVVGITFLEIVHAEDLPPERNVTRTGFDMDPFVIVTYGTSTFRTRAIRHNLNPVWNEKLFFHVRQNEANYKLKFAVYDKDKFSGNDFVAWQELPIMSIIRESKTKRDSISENAIPADAIEADMGLHTIPLQMVKQEKWQDRHPTLTIRAKFVPYAEIRRLFWLALARTYDVDESGTMNRLEVQSMLESLGSTISEATLDSFWTQHGKDPNDEADALSMDELVQSLENFMLSVDEKPSTATSESSMTTDSGIPVAVVDEHASEYPPQPDRSEMSEQEDGGEFSTFDDDFGPFFEETYSSTVFTEEEDEDDDDDSVEPLRDAQGVQYMDDPVLPFQPTLSSGSSDAIKDEDRENEEGEEDEEEEGDEDDDDDDEDDTTGDAAMHGKRANEKIIRLKECPICHRPNLAKRAQMDIVTHVATCAADDWTTVDRFLMGNFVTEAYAQRRWFVKLVSSVGYGRYALGRNNANIIIQDRLSGQLIEERMSVYVRLGMRLLYKGMKTGIQSKTAQRVLTNMTVRQGRRFDSPQSAREILPFIKFHKLDMREVRDPISSFKTFNEFFYRKLKPDARPCECPDDPRVIVSPADCRMLAFQTVDDATRIWIKGTDFTLKKLLGSDKGDHFGGGSLAVFRLAPQDYHRFHCPVDGVITETTIIEGQYYTVNPMAIRTTLDVYGDNARAIVQMDTDEFGKVAIVCIGAMMVGSIILTAKSGQHLARTDELGYFAFGGSTLVVLWEKGAIQFDNDLLQNSEKPLESLVRVGNRIGCRA
ncbi:phosphatidylserine decarboxylase-domain-containing protein [Radiomyces spectabilis]|uniref:phosphatidylserine decarboxylase-domain-containing protein n=1 Tax=Radiomyces spectabilis TaxID=64574 RepID=UPI002220D2F6|nr:phosphatidylserine decarboxylase-domain-containing protein [Radiomyces spectabilis]KAI8379112.1 phosphatidylserine decarboxylase-domain-containing protein [Radiomyces spectabilis]